MDRFFPWIIPCIFPDDMSETMTNKCQGGDHSSKVILSTENRKINSKRRQFLADY